LKGAAETADLQLTATETGIDADLRGVSAIGEPERRRLAALVGSLGLARLTLHGSLVMERARPKLAMGRARLTPPPGGFLQATAAGEETLARLAIEALPARVKRVADLFSGVGPFALRIAERAAVMAVDSDAPALAGLLEAYRGAQGLKPVETLRRDLFRTPMAPRELDGFDAALFDPPRAGAEAQAAMLARSALPVVIAVSCNAETFARDAAILVSGGFALESVTPVDQFLFSPHVEIVARFARRAQTARGR
jgi:23S rRNA (uracil1939-C5)-methyltransferase